MTIVKAQPGEPADSVIRKFSKKVLMDGILLELKKHEFYQKPSTLRQQARAALRKKRPLIKKRRP
ncbi:MAG: 30S ribosomal protein S21 [bacterium]|nr:30S ribosomal protein S21 [bacterium]